MPNPRCLVSTVALALALSSCFENRESGDGSAIVGEPEFVRLVEDARFEAEQGNLSQAGLLLDEAHEIEPDNPGLWVSIARLRFRGGEQLSALEAADYALELGPQYAPALFMRAQLVRDAHGLADAVPWFEAAVQADPKNTALLADYAATLGDLGRNQDMLIVVRELTKIEPRNPQAFYLQAVLAARAGETVLSRSLLSRSGLVERGVPAAILLDALIDMQQATPDNAVQSLQNLVERQPGNKRVQELLAKALWLSGRDDEMIEQFGARALAPDASPYLMELVGRTHERLGNRTDAAVLLDRARSIPPAQWAVLESSTTGRADLPTPTAEIRQLVGAQDLAGADAIAEEWMGRFPDSSDIRALAGDAALANGNSQAALVRYAAASKVRRPWPLTRKIVAAYRNYGDDRAGDALLVRHLIGEPNNTEALMMMAARSEQAEDWLRVVVLLDHAIALGAGNDPALVTLRLQAAESLGREDEARHLRSRALEILPEAFVAS